ncbi:MAG: class I SAM-dependent methyltransferase [Streptosporangiaceae bacterium]
MKAPDIPHDSPETLVRARRAVPPVRQAGGINYERMYEWRFRDVDQSRRQAVWREIARYVHRRMGAPARVLDPAAGRGEFITAVPAAERWGVDLVSHGVPESAGVNMIITDIMAADIPSDYFDGVFVSNFLEHLPDQNAVATVLGKLHNSLTPGGRIAIIGPNFRYCAREYFDCADHTVILSHIAVTEHLYAAGFDVTWVAARFLPYSFRGLLPPSPALTRIYLQTPVLWRLLGKQFLVLARKPLVTPAG